MRCHPYFGFKMFYSLSLSIGGNFLSIPDHAQVNKHPQIIFFSICHLPQGADGAGGHYCLIQTWLLNNKGLKWEDVNCIFVMFCLKAESCVWWWVFMYSHTYLPQSGTFCKSVTFTVMKGENTLLFMKIWPLTITIIIANWWRLIFSDSTFGKCSYYHSAQFSWRMIFSLHKRFPLLLWVGSYI